VKPGYEPGGKWEDPKARQDWVDDLKNGPDTGPDRVRRTTNSDEPDIQYQHDKAGPEEYRLHGEGADPVWADGVRVDPDGVAEVDAKFVVNPGGRSAYEGGRPPFMYSDLDHELDRYAAVIRDPANPVTRFSIITNTQKAADFLLQHAREIMGRDIDIEVRVEP